MILPSLPPPLPPPHLPPPSCPGADGAVGVQQGVWWIPDHPTTAGILIPRWVTQSHNSYQSAAESAYLSHTQPLLSGSLPYFRPSFP